MPILAIIGCILAGLMAIGLVVYLAYLALLLCGALFVVWATWEILSALGKWGDGFWRARRVSALPGQIQSRASLPPALQHSIPVRAVPVENSQPTVPIPTPTIPTPATRRRPSRRAQSPNRGGAGIGPVYAAMRRHNPNALIAMEDGVVCMIEDHADPDGRLYRLEYQSTRDGARAVAWCRTNPWGSSPNADTEPGEAHVNQEGLICLGVGTTRVLRHSPFDFDFALRRGRSWCTAFSVYQETGEFPDV